MEKPMGTVTKTIYKVETTFPNGKVEDEGKFGTYYSSAYCLSDDPGTQHSKLAMVRYRDLFDKSLVRDQMHFSTAEDAKAVADLLRERGRLCAGWEGNNSEEWRKAYRLPLQSRVVLEITIIHRELVL